MPGGLPEAAIVDEGCPYLLVAFTEIEFPHLFGEEIVNEPRLWEAKMHFRGILDASERVPIRARVYDGRVWAASSRCVKYA